MGFGRTRGSLRGRWGNVGGPGHCRGEEQGAKGTRRRSGSLGEIRLRQPLLRPPLCSTLDQLVSRDWAECGVGVGRAYFWVRARGSHPDPSVSAELCPHRV